MKSFRLQQTTALLSGVVLCALLVLGGVVHAENESVETTEFGSTVEEKTTISDAADEEALSNPSEEILKGTPPEKKDEKSATSEVVAPPNGEMELREASPEAPSTTPAEKPVSETTPEKPSKAPEEPVQPKSQWVYTEDGKWYYYDENGNKFYNRLISFNDIMYYMGEDGSAETGIISYNGNYYYADVETRQIQKKGSWISYEGNDYYPTKTGVLYKNTFISFGSEYYYLGADASLQHGFFVHADQLYYADPVSGLVRKNAGWFEMDGKRYYSDTTGRFFRNQFISFGGSVRYYMGADGSVQYGLFSHEGKSYFADEDGKVSENARWITIEGKRYYSKANGELYKNCFLRFGSERFYMGEDGAVQTGFFRVNGDLYFADPTSGDVRSSAGWFEQNGKMYYSDAQGRFFYNQKISFNSDLYFYMDQNGARASGLLEIENEFYYADPDDGHLLLNQWVNVDEEAYYADAFGRFYRNQFISFGPAVKYYMGPDGSKQKGIIEADGTIYRLDENTGALVQKAGWVEYNGKMYYMDQNGVPFRNQLISFGGNEAYYMGADGSKSTGFVSYYGYLYYARPEDGNVYAITGAFEVDGKEYYAQSNHILRRNQWLSYGKDYFYYKDDGSMAKNETVVINTVPYRFNENGVRENRYGIHTINGKQYYFSTRSGLPFIGWINDGNYKYYADSTGALLVGLQWIDGNPYYFNEHTEHPAMVTNASFWFYDKQYAFGPDGVGRLVKKIWRFRERFIYEDGLLKIFDKSGNYQRSRYVGGNHILISIPNQYMWVFNGGRLVKEVPVISGAPSTGTPAGNFSIIGKRTNTYLTGADYRVRVDWWMEFLPSYGIHDGSWQKLSSYHMDSLAYYQEGSHGCVNVPWASMEEVYNATYVGMPVTIAR
uniref:L,D-transpeptidase family protein n=1 Tax=Ndongobacter massiliensis TaxID=1871025 RepID=UPI000931227B|nr:L,D-transpeptidase family protein [Ndongobacter massiliensis]